MNNEYIAARHRLMKEIANLLSTFKGSMSFQEILETPIPYLHSLYSEYEKIKTPLDGLT
jgi:hypothetical protein